MTRGHQRCVELRRWSRDDAPSLAVLFDDPLVYQFTPVREPFDLPAAQRRIEIGARGEDEGRLWFRAITVDGLPAGEVAAYRRAESGDASLAGISYVVGAPFRGGGVGCRAVGLMIEELHREWHPDLLVADISPDNFASQRVARAHGFEPELAAEPVRREGKDYSTIPWILACGR